MVLGHHGLPQRARRLLLPCLGWLSRLGHARVVQSPTNSHGLGPRVFTLALLPCHSVSCELQSCLLEPEAAAHQPHILGELFSQVVHLLLQAPPGLSLGRHHRVEVGVEAAELKLGASSRAVS